MSLHVVFQWLLVQSLQDSIHNVFKVWVQYIAALENLKNDLKHKSTLSVVYCDTWFDTEHCLICHPDEHLNATRLLHQLLVSVDQIAVNSFKKCAITETLLVLVKNMFQGR